MKKFLLKIFHTAVSGFQNGAGYGKHWGLFSLFSILEIATPYFTWKGMKRWQKVMCIISTIGSLMTIASFIFPPAALLDIHLWETVTTSFYSFSQVSTLKEGIIIALATIPGLVLHKIGVNILGGSKWNYNGTDDVTGKTFSIPSLGMKIPRLTFNNHLIIAAISIGLFFGFKSKLEVKPLPVRYTTHIKSQYPDLKIVFRKPLLRA